MILNNHLSMVKAYRSTCLHQRFRKNTNADFKLSNSSRVLCVVPDALLDLSTTEIILVWPQSGLKSTNTQSQQPADTTAKVVLFPSGRSNVPVLINTGLQGPTLLNF